jgi:tetratricopeptide (TPR) repeat protein
MPARRPTRAPATGLCVLLLLIAVPVQPHAQESAAALREQGLDLAYDLDHQEALAKLRRAAALAPDDTAAHRSLASVLWLNMLFQRGAVTVDHYLGSFTRSNIALAKPSPEMDAEFRQHMMRALELAERDVTAHPRSAQAHYDLGAALGIQASYIATVEGRMLGGLNAARKAYDEHEKVLSLDPSKKDAQLIVGTYRYLVSTLSLPMRWMAYLAGLGGGKERGIQLLEDTAATGRETRTDALFALVLVYNREQRYDDALRALQELRRLHPRNRLILLEAGSTALRGNRPQQAEALLTEGLAMFAKDNRIHVPGEDALWHYKRGAARVAGGQVETGVMDLQRATTASPAEWVEGRARVELGRVALKRGEREVAAGEARRAETLCQQGRDPVCVDQAQELMRDSHGR